MSAPLARRTPFHDGWVLVAAGIAGNMVAAGSLFWAISLDVPAMSREFDGERTPIVTAFMAGQAVYALLGPWAGRYIDRDGARRVLLGGALLAPSALLWTAHPAHADPVQLGDHAPVRGAPPAGGARRGQRRLRSRRRRDAADALGDSRAAAGGRR